MTTDVPSGRPATIPTPEPGDVRLARLSLNQRTCANWSLAEAVDGCVVAGLGAIGTVLAATWRVTDARHRLRLDRLQPR